MQPKFWDVNNMVCEECCLPLGLYGPNTVDTIKWGKDRIITRFFCDLHLLEYQVTERAKAKFYADQKRAKLEQLEVCL